MEDTQNKCNTPEIFSDNDNHNKRWNVHAHSKPIINKNHRHQTKDKSHIADH